MSITITGTGSSLPPLSVTNHDLSEILDTSHEWIESRTGIESRHICEHGLTQTAAEAGANALKNAGRAADELDYILCATMSADYVTPALACLVQQEARRIVSGAGHQRRVLRLHLWPGHGAGTHHFGAGKSAYCSSRPNR